jgi:hypothetical protein
MVGAASVLKAEPRRVLMKCAMFAGITAAAAIWSFNSIASERPPGCIPAAPVLEHLQRDNPELLVLSGDEARRWLAAFNSIPPRSRYVADRLIVEYAPTSHIVWLVRQDFVCERIAIAAQAAKLVLLFARGQPI